MSHANAALTPRHRLRLARLIVEERWPTARAAESFNVTWRAADKWAQRYQAERASRDERPILGTPHPGAKTPQPVVRKIVHLR